MLRLATFNVENLFDRPKIINLKDPARSAGLLKKASELQEELAKATYDKPKLEALIDDLRGYVTIRVDRGKFFQGQTRTKVGAQGRDDWDGAVEFVRSRFNEQQRKNTAHVIKEIDADVMCLIEVEGRQSLLDFMREYITNTRKRLGRNMLIDSPIDPRGIDVAVAWRNANLGIIRSNAYDQRIVNNRTVTVWSRDCLEVELQLSGGESLWILANHFKSKMGGNPPAARNKRLAQGERLAEILSTRYDLTQDYVVVMGDLNDTPDSPALQPLYQLGTLHDVLELAQVPAADRWTYYYGGASVAQRKTQIDYLFVSDSLQNHVANVQLHRRGMSAVAEGKIPGVTPYPGITSWRDAASDHAAISVDLMNLS